MPKQKTYTVSIGEDKATIMRSFMLSKNIDDPEQEVSKQLDECLKKLYEKYVPERVREDVERSE